MDMNEKWKMKIRSIISSNISTNFRCVDNCASNWYKSLL
ncbi:hypothetical protein ERO13_A04G021850v2 [Gossypium hirsutum]|nr:hypothetical protein ERO13_A04G021850v2 [Gossypium hirsutum]